VFKQSAKFWRASDSFFQSASSAPAYGRAQGGRVYTFDRWDEWVRRSRKPERKVRKMPISVWQNSRAKSPFLKEFRGVDTRLSRLDPNKSVAIAIRTDPSTRQNLLNIAGSVGPIVSAQMDEALASIAFNAWRRWPWDTKLSKALLSLEYKILPNGVFQGSVHSNAWYTYYIKSRQNGLGGKQPHRELIFAPAEPKMAAAAEKIAAQIATYSKGTTV